MSRVVWQQNYRSSLTAELRELAIAPDLAGKEHEKDSISKEKLHMQDSHKKPKVGEVNDINNYNCAGCYQANRAV